MASAAQRQAEYKQRMREQGFALVAEWIRETDRAALKAFAQASRNGTLAADYGTSNTTLPEPAPKPEPKPDTNPEQVKLHRAFIKAAPAIFNDAAGNAHEGRVLSRRVRRKSRPWSVAAEIMHKAADGNISVYTFLDGRCGERRLDMTAEVESLNQRLDDLRAKGRMAAAKEHTVMIDCYRRLGY